MRMAEIGGVIVDTRNHVDSVVSAGFVQDLLLPRPTPVQLDAYLFILHKMSFGSRRQAYSIRKEAPH